MRCIVFRVILCCLTVLALGGCYYEIHDTNSGKSFFTEQWAAADGYQGPLTFEDHTGAKRRVEHAQVFRIGKRDYHEATTPSDEAATTDQTAPPE